MAGYLLFPPGYTPLYQGSPVPSGKLRFRRTGTSTPQDTFSDSALGVANSNPVELDANGSLTVNVYGSATGFAYRVQLLTSADAVLWTLDDVSAEIADGALSDNVPLLDQDNVFTGDTQKITAADAGFRVRNTSGGANAKVGDFISTSGSLNIRAINDAEDAVLRVPFIYVFATDVTTISDTVAAGGGTIATNASAGFLYVPTCAGTPTGTPTGVSGYAPIVIDTTNSKLYFYSNGAWRDAGP